MINNAELLTTSNLLNVIEKQKYAEGFPLCSI